MPLRILLRPIVPKNKIVSVDIAKITRALVDMGATAVNTLADYPTAAPVPSTRKGILGKGWNSASPRVIGNNLVVTVGNKIAEDYAVFVQGPGQTEKYSKYGWPTVTDAAKKADRDHGNQLRRAVQGK